jgi:hypothetical protein
MSSNNKYLLWERKKKSCTNQRIDFLFFEMHAAFYLEHCDCLITFKKQNCACTVDRRGNTGLQVGALPGVRFLTWWRALSIARAGPTRAVFIFKEWGGGEHHVH